MIEEVQSVLIKGQLYVFKTYDEADLTQDQFQVIQQGLNEAYGFRTQSFAHKPYGYCLPLKRILCTLGDKLVGHVAIFEDCVSLNDKKIKVGGIGLTFSLKPLTGLGFMLRELAAKLCAKSGVPLAIGRVKNSARIKKNLEPLVSCFLEMPLVGANTHSHEWETLAIYKTSDQPDWVNQLIANFQKNGCIQIEGEVF